MKITHIALLVGVSFFAQSGKAFDLQEVTLKQEVINPTYGDRVDLLPSALPGSGAELSYETSLESNCRVIYTECYIHGGPPYNERCVVVALHGRPIQQFSLGQTPTVNQIKIALSKGAKVKRWLESRGLCR